VTKRWQVVTYSVIFSVWGSNLQRLGCKLQLSLSLPNIASPLSYREHCSVPSDILQEDTFQVTSAPFHTAVWDLVSWLHLYWSPGQKTVLRIRCCKSLWDSAPWSISSSWLRNSKLLSQSTENALIYSGVSDPS